MMGAVEKIKRNGNEVKEHRRASLEGVNVKAEEDPTEGKERRQMQESGASWHQRPQDPEKRALAFTWS